MMRLVGFCFVCFQGDKLLALREKDRNKKNVESAKRLVELLKNPFKCENQSSDSGDRERRICEDKCSASLLVIRL